jgi:hypothetical protein
MIHESLRSMLFLTLRIWDCESTSNVGPGWKASSADGFNEARVVALGLIGRAGEQEGQKSALSWQRVNARRGGSPGSPGSSDQPEELEDRLLVRRRIQAGSRVHNGEEGKPDHPLPRRAAVMYRNCSRAIWAPANAIGALAIAHKTHTGFAIRAEYADCADYGISNLLITGHAEWFNSVPGHHHFKRLSGAEPKFPTHDS